MKSAQCLPDNPADLQRQLSELRLSEASLRQTVADLKNSEAFFRAITQNSSDIIIVVNEKAEITYVNPSIEQFLGYRPVELIGRIAFDYFDPSELERAMPDFDQSLQTIETKIFNAFSIRHKDGSTRILEGIGINLLHDSVVKGFVMNVRDITDRRRAEGELAIHQRHLEELVEKRTAEISCVNAQLLDQLAERKNAENALKESEEKYRDFIENAPIGVAIIDVSGKIRYVNKRIEESMGWSRDKLIGTDGFGLETFDDGTRKHLLERFAARMQGDMQRLMEIPLTRKDQPPLWVEVITTVLKKDETPVGAQMVFVNVTERKQAEEALRKSEDRFRTLIQRSSDVISIVSPDGRIIYISPSAEVILGYPPDALIGKLPFDFIHPDDHAILHSRLAGLIDKTNQGTATEFRGLRGDGIWRFYEATGTNLIDYEGINGIVLTIRDINNRKLAEEKNKALTERLHRAEKMESLGTLAGGVAHDLNNVLGVLVGYTDLILTKMGDDNPYKKHLLSIMKSSEKATAIIQDLLTLARRNVPVSEVVNLNAVVAEYFISPEFDRLRSYHPNVTFQNDMAKDLLNVKVSAVHLGKTVMNLISNAVEAIADTGEVTVATQNCYLDRPVSGYTDVREGDYASLTIRDNGQGISAGDMEKIFEPFYTKKVMGRSGTGLGLAVVWGTVKDHQGYIRVQSEMGKGSEFTLYFPATRETTTKSPKARSIETYMGDGESILVIDDMPEQREVAASLLARLGYQAHTVGSGEEAVDYLKKNKADMLLLDMIMDPGIDGLETYRRILDIDPKQKAVIVSGYSETNRVKQALALGASAYIRKPYMLDTLGMTLRKALSGL